MTSEPEQKVGLLDWIKTKKRLPVAILLAYALVMASLSGTQYAFASYDAQLSAVDPNAWDIQSATASMQRVRTLYRQQTGEAQDILSASIMNLQNTPELLVCEEDSAEPVPPLYTTAPRTIAYQLDTDSAGSALTLNADGTVAASTTAEDTQATLNAAALSGARAGDIASWQKINSDVQAWLRVPGTNIDYPVVIASDVMYYNARGYYKEPSYYGVIWTNPSTTFGSSSSISPNTVLYGHNWTNYSASPRIASSQDIMFGQLTSYHYLSHAQSYPYIYYSTASEQMTFKIFAVFYTEVSFQYNSTSGGQAIIDEARLRSRFNFDVDVSSSDKILTLSTCTRAYGSTNNQRFVVMARLLRPGESTSSYSITNNPNHKQPNVW